jgi:hypothetical protein
MGSIPVIGTAIVNTPYWLHRLYMSIDYPVDNFVVFNNNGRGQITNEVDLIKEIPNRYIKNVHVCHLPANVGCSGAWMVEKYGLFDENLYPGYCEDMDYGMRFIHDDVKRVLSLDSDYYHGSKKNDYSDGSQTWRSEPSIAQGIHVAHEMNKRYLHLKWNEAWQAHVEGETNKTPFNIPDMPVSFTTYDLGFVRRKHLGF